MKELSNVSLRHTFIRDAVALWPSILRQVVRAEHAIDQGKMDGVVDVHGFLFDAMVPVVESGRRQNVLQPAKVETQVRMDEGRQQVDEEDLGI